MYWIMKFLIKINLARLQLISFDKEPLNLSVQLPRCLLSVRVNYLKASGKYYQYSWQGYWKLYFVFDLETFTFAVLNFKWRRLKHFSQTLVIVVHLVQTKYFLCAIHSLVNILYDEIRFELKINKKNQPLLKSKYE